MREEEFHYALDNTQLLLAPRGRLETFGTCIVNYHLVTEEMDSINLSRVREGQVLAERPQLITPGAMQKLLLEGFGEEAHDFAEKAHPEMRNLAALKYGFRISKNEVRLYEVNESIQIVSDRVLQEVKAHNDPLAAVLTGIDDGWEVSLLKLMLNLVIASAGHNIQDFKNRGLL